MAASCEDQKPEPAGHDRELADKRPGTAAKTGSLRFGRSDCQSCGLRSIVSGGFF
jgi:hypothetical protein